MKKRVRDRWANPVPRGARRDVRVYRAAESVELVADAVCLGGWRGQGVRVYAWPCGTLAVVTVGTGADTQLAAQCADRHVGTYARARLHGRCVGPLRAHVLEDLAWARSAGGVLA